MKTKFLSIFLLMTSIAFAQFPTNGLIAQYGFDNGSLVDGANGVNFSQHGSAAIAVNDRFGMTSGALQLNGDDFQRSNLNHTSSYDDISISFWIKTSTNESNSRTIIFDQGATFNTGYQVYLKDGRVHFRTEFLLGSNRVVNNIISPNISDDNWHHVVVTTRFLISKIYIDSALEATSSNPSASSFANRLFDSSGIVGLARNRSAHATATNGYRDVIDDLLFYNRELSAAEIISIGTYNNYCFGLSTAILSSSNVTTTNIDINVAGSETVDIAYHEASLPFSAATIVTNIAGGSSTSITGTSAETYKVYVRKNCGNGNVSNWSSFALYRNEGVGIFVKADATGNNDGTSWANAFTDLSSTIANANNGEEIWVASGTYKPHASDRSVYFTISQNDLKIYGGFDGTETQISDRTIGMNETILSGDLQGNDVNTSDFVSSYFNTTRNADNSYHIINITGNNVLLDGLTISDAHNNLSGTERGGAIVKEKTVAKVTMVNCIVKDNVSRNDNATIIAEFELNNVGGMRGELLIENCQFVNNMSRWATGVYSYIRNNTQVDIKISNSLFDKNIAGDLNNTTATGLSGSAGWLRNIGNANSELSIELVNNTFVNNIATGTNQSLNNFTRATFALSKNNATAGNTTAVVANCIFWNNESAGGGIARSITDQYRLPINSLTIINSIDEANFNDDSITITMNTSNSDPLFTDAANDDFTLAMTSPAVDSGDNTAVIGTTDLLGNQRVFNTTVDMGAYEYGSMPLSVTDSDLNENEVKIYPNPTSSNVNIQTNANVKSISIYTLLGEEILTTTAVKIDVSHLTSGMYILKIISGKGMETTKRFIKQ